MQIKTRQNINGNIVATVEFKGKTFVRIQKNKFDDVSLEPIVEWKNKKTNHLVNAKKHKALEEQFKLIDTITKTELDYAKTNSGPALLPESGGTMYFAFDIAPYEKTKEELIADAAADSKILEYCKAGRLLEAVKFYKEYAGLGLKEAKDYVDALREKNSKTMMKANFEIRMSG